LRTKVKKFACIHEGPVVQWIGRNFAEVAMQVRFLPGSQKIALAIFAERANCFARVQESKDFSVLLRN
jgi:hypothetical protein